MNKELFNDLFGSNDSDDYEENDIFENILQSIVNVVKVENVGGERGVISNTFIPYGTLIVIESPTIEWYDLDLSNYIDLISLIKRILLSSKAYNITKLLHPTSYELISNDDIIKLETEIIYSLFDSIVNEFNMSLEEVIRIYMVLQHNGFSSGLYQQLTMFNHSCSPNCIKYLPKGSSLNASEIWTVKDIEPGEELTINYLEKLESSRNCRQKYLLEHHRFICNCELCSSYNNDSNEYNDFLSIEDEWYNKLAKLENISSSAIVDQNISNIVEIINEMTILLESVDSYNYSEKFIKYVCMFMSRLVSKLIDVLAVYITLIEKNGKESLEKAGLSFIQYNLELIQLQEIYLSSNHPNLIRTYIDIESGLTSLRDRFPNSIPLISSTINSDNINEIIKSYKKKSLDLKDRYTTIKRYPNYYRHLQGPGSCYWNNIIN